MTQITRSVKGQVLEAVERFRGGLETARASVQRATEYLAGPSAQNLTDKIINRAIYERGSIGSNSETWMPEALRKELTRIQEAGLYERLGVKNDASQGEINVALLRGTQKFHGKLNASAEPEVGQLRSEIMSLMKEAHSILSDSAKRAMYDLSLRKLNEGNRLPEGTGTGTTDRIDEAREFPLGLILSVAKDRALHKSRSMLEVAEIVCFLVGEPYESTAITMNGLKAYPFRRLLEVALQHKDEMPQIIYEQYPELRDLKVPDRFSSKEAVWKWVEQQEAKFGKTLKLRPVRRQSSEI